MQSGKGRRTRAKKGLRKLGQASIYETNPGDYAKMLRAESDRGAVIMMASFIEDTLTEQLRAQLLQADPGLEDALFGPRGIAGSFGAKTVLGTAIGIVTPAVAALIDHVREVRNTAAHFVADVTFDTPELRDALLALVDDESQAALSSADRFEIRDAFLACTMVIQQLVGERFKIEGADELRKTAGDIAQRGVEATGSLPFSQLYRRATLADR